MEQEKELTINLALLWQKIWSKRWLYVVLVPVVTLLSAAYIVSLPRTYTSDLKLAPELGGDQTKSSLGSLASSLGFDLGDMQSTDAITPLLYPTLLEDNHFIGSLLTIRVQAADSLPSMPYYEYLIAHQKSPWWSKTSAKALHERALLVQMFKQGKVKPYSLTKDEGAVYEAVRDALTLKVDQKNGVITITATDQSPQVCQLLCDSLRSKLQQFITAYRTARATRDYNYYKKLASEAKSKYEQARQLYGSYADANTDVVLESFIAKRNDLENDMQLKYNAYTQLLTQQNAAQAKIQERTPAFTLLKGASLPIKPSAPKRVVFVLVMNILAVLLLTVGVLRKELLQVFN